MSLNRLAQSKSLYLRKHATNPIQWWPWCDEALSLAKESDRPIFLSVGYSSCHWCTVMEGEAFSNDAIATYLNANFVPIKVDREERPDLDSLYMQSLQAMTGQGGWPMNVFISPDDGIPFYGGTYFPVEAKYGRAGFLQVLQAVRNFYDTEKAKLADQKRTLFAHLSEMAQFKAQETLSPETLDRGLEAATLIIGNQTPGPNFPMMPYAFVTLQSMYKLSQKKHDSLNVAKQRGMDLVLGGIYDHVAGGFHRYTVDSTWTVPHFEKMLYDNGQILEYLANLWHAGIRDEAILRAIAGTVSWLTREMTHEMGFFYAAQDADNFASPTELEPEEGEFYVWDYQQLQGLLTEQELAAFVQDFDIRPDGNFEGRTVLQRRKGGVLSSDSEIALDKLFFVRYGQNAEQLSIFAPAKDNQAAKAQPWPGRTPPVTDTKMIVAWNSLMISGLARAAIVLDSVQTLGIATKAAQFIADHQWRDGQLLRLNYEGEAMVSGQSEDYAFLIKGLLDLHQACLVLDPNQASFWQEKAIAAQNSFDQTLGCASGGFFNTGIKTDALLNLREKSWQDNATPSANGIGITNLIRLAIVTENNDWLTRAETSLKAFGSVMTEQPQMCPTLFGAMDWFYNGVTIKLLPTVIKQSLQDQYWPTSVHLPTNNLPANVIGIVCTQQTCQPFSESIAELNLQIMTLLQ